MKSHFLRSLAVFLTLAMLIQLLPVQVLAVDEDEFTPEDVVLSEEWRISLRLLKNWRQKNRCQQTFPLK